MRALATLVAVLVPLHAGAAETPPGPQLGKPAPLFSLRDREGALVSLGDLAYAGPERPTRPRHVVVLDFFRTDCKPCIKALPKLVELHRKYHGKRVKVILVALLEEEEGQEKLDRFLESQRLPFLVLVDPYAAAGKKYVEKAGNVQIPALFVIDRSGVLRHRAQGMTAQAAPKLHKLIDGLLK